MNDGHDAKGTVLELLDQASRLPAEERRGFLETQIGDDSELLSTLNQHLEEDDSLFVPGGALQGDLFKNLASTPQGPEGHGRLGPYRLLDKLGQGGMGEVWRAEQLEPVRRDVAIKLIRLGMDSEEVLARFHAERQALARMDHTNVARVYDARTTNAGRPYFVMELIQGSPITDFCDKHKLTTEERLRLFLSVCAGVEHAHQKGIIHRDLKPTNILVTREADRPVPKIIDFGIAKAVGEPLADGAARTRLGQWIGTPEYMSPEQADMGTDDVDTRTDVYSLGAILYELLIGTRIFTQDSMRRSSVDEMRNQIRNNDPSRPSDRLSSLNQDATEVAQNRRTEARQLMRAIKGDLDWIVMKALEKDRDRRYASAREMAQDVERHLNNQPVLAGPPSFSYLAKKFVRRHRLGVAAASGIAAALIAGVSMATVGMIRARVAEQAAIEAQQVALAEAAKANEINRFLRTLLGSARPEGGVGRDITVVDALGRARERLSESFQDNPEIGADVRNVIGTTYHELGLHEEAQELLEEALEMRRETLGSDHPEVAGTLNELARLNHTIGNLEAAERYFLETIEVLQAALGREHTHVAATLNNLGMLYVHQGRQDEALSTLTEALELKRQLHGPVHEEVMPTLNNLGMLLADMGRHDEAERYFKQALEGNRELHGEEHALVAINLSNLASCYDDQGRWDEALEAFQQSLSIKENAYGKQHLSYANTLSGIAKVLDHQGKHEEARPMHEQALEIFRAALPADSFRIGAAQAVYGLNLMELGLLEQSEIELEQGQSILEATFGPEDERVLKARDSLQQIREQLAAD